MVTRWQHFLTTHEFWGSFFFLFLVFYCNFLAILYWNRVDFWCGICFQCIGNNLVIYRRFSILFHVLFCIYVITVCSIKFPLLSSSSFWDQLFDIYYCVRVNSELLISPTCFLRMGALQRATGTQGSLWRYTACLLHAPSSLSPRTLQPWYPRQSGSRDVTTSPGHYGLRGIEPAFLFLCFSGFALRF